MIVPVRFVKPRVVSTFFAEVPPPLLQVVTDGAFDRTVKGLRNTVLLPPGWEVASVSQSGTIGVYRGRAFVAFVNLNAENSHRVVITARRRP